MPPIYGPRGQVLSHAPEWRELEKTVQKGDGYGWPGDPNMRVQVGELRASNGKVGRRLEVWRHNEDGSDTMIGHWLPREQHMVCYDLARMRVDSPGHEDALDRIDKHNAQIEKQRSDEYRDAMGAMLEHAIHLHHDRSGAPKTTFYGMGIKDKPLNVKSKAPS